MNDFFHLIVFNTITFLCCVSVIRDFSRWFLCFFPFFLLLKLLITKIKPCIKVHTGSISGNYFCEKDCVSQKICSNLQISVKQILVLAYGAYLKIDGRSTRVGTFNSILVIIANKMHTKIYKKTCDMQRNHFFHWTNGFT